MSSSDNMVCRSVCTNMEKKITFHIGYCFLVEKGTVHYSKSNYLGSFTNVKNVLTTKGNHTKGDDYVQP